MSTRTSRRTVLTNAAKFAAVSVAAPYLIPSGVLAAPGRPGANDRVGLGYIGVGRRARQVMQLPPNARIVALADVYEPRLGEVGKDQPLGRYTDYRKLLEDKNVDAVVVATPDHWHALPSIHACQAGKDVYCEKPLSLTVREGRAMVEAARRYQRVFQTGSQQRSEGACRAGIKLIHQGLVGRIRSVQGQCYPSPIDVCDLPGEPTPAGLDWDTWCGQTTPRPFCKDVFAPRAKPGWISFRAYSGGEVTGWGAHGLDVIQWALKVDESGPVEIWPEGTGPNCPVHLLYANGVLVRLDSKGLGSGGAFTGEGGVITVERGAYKVEPKSLTPAKGSKDEQPERTDRHMDNWINCIISREKPVADVEIGHRSCTVCHLVNIARWTGRRLKWDAKAERFIGDPEADRLLERPMRAPYGLPSLAAASRTT